MNEAIKILRSRLDGRTPKIALVLGSGLGGLSDDLIDPIVIKFSELPGFPHSGVSGHAGQIISGELNGVPVLALSGRVHYYEKGDAAAMRPVLETFKAIGITQLILTNAAGGLRQDLAPGSVMLITDHINFSGTNPLIGEPTDDRFVGMTNAYDAAMSNTFRDAAKATGTELGEGTYMWFSGPSFETPAEIRMARVMGADAVGMSTVPEVILARFLAMRVAACSVITNFGAGMTGGELSHHETKDIAPIGGAKLGILISHVVAHIE